MGCRGYAAYRHAVDPGLIKTDEFRGVGRLGSRSRYGNGSRQPADGRRLALELRTNTQSTPLMGCPVRGDIRPKRLDIEPDGPSGSSIPSVGDNGRSIT